MYDDKEFENSFTENYPEKPEFKKENANDSVTFLYLAAHLNQRIVFN